MNRNSKPKIKEHLRIREEEFGALIFDPVIGRMHKLNRDGYKILKYCNGDMTLEEIVKKVLDEEGGDAEEIETNLKEFFENMKSRGLMEF